MRSDDIVRLVTASNPAEAHVLEQGLRDEGIEAKVVGDYLDAGLGDIPGLRAEVWVHRDELDRALEVLAAHRSRPEAPTAEEE